MPKNPQRKPKPNACEVSSSKVRKHHSVAVFPYNHAALQNHRFLPEKYRQIPSASHLQNPLMTILVKDWLRSGNGITYFYFFGIFNSGDDIAHISAFYFVSRADIPIFKIPISSASYSYLVLTNFILSPFLRVPLKMRK